MFNEWVQPFEYLNKECKKKKLGQIIFHDAFMYNIINLDDIQNLT